jgi:hypothetical protein
MRNTRPRSSPAIAEAAIEAVSSSLPSSTTISSRA